VFVCACMYLCVFRGYVLNFRGAVGRAYIVRSGREVVIYPEVNLGGRGIAGDGHQLTAMTAGLRHAGC